MNFWPGTNLRRSTANDFTLHERLEHSCMWTQQGETYAKKQAERAAKMTAAEQARKVKAFKPSAIGNFAAEAVVATDKRRAADRRARAKRSDVREAA